MVMGVPGGIDGNTIAFSAKVEDIIRLGLHTAGEEGGQKNEHSTTIGSIPHFFFFSGPIFFFFFYLKVSNPSKPQASHYDIMMDPFFKIWLL